MGGHGLMKIRYPLLRPVILFTLMSSIGTSSPRHQHPFSLFIRAVAPTVKIGSEVRIDVTLRNITNHEIGILSSDPESEYMVEVRDDQGRMAPESDFNRKLKAPGSARIITNSPIYPLQPHKTLKQQIVVSGLYEMSTPTRYSISVSRTVPEELGSGVIKSNTVTVIVVR